ncbi:MAG: branched-chain amino acid aminotransferase [Rhodospirillales bacterium]|jgi:branched-chain amino acid aminotransferase|nr:branched-chain amino acid aminotransferase [Rhodospirillales bacterium]MDP7650385.1 branched-chain amino acid aminotransferase [Rhodospirillales bacterium]
MAKDTTTARHTVTYVDGTWQDGNPQVLGPRSHAVWLGSAVFDGARAIQGRAPDLDRHCARVVISARLMGLEPMLTGTEIEDLARDGIGRFAGDADLYICPMFYPEDGFIVPDPASTHFILTVHESPLPEPSGISACLSSFRRPARDMAPTEAKAACLYPNVARCLREAQAKGFETAVVLDPSGNVAEFAYANLFMVKDGVVATPVSNGTFLNGITRQRVIELLRSDGVEVIERSIGFSEVLAADELFGTGNYAKVVPYTRIEDRELEAGQMTRRARELYFRFAGQAAM